MMEDPDGNESSNQASSTTAENTRLLHGDKAPSRDSENVLQHGSAGQSNESQGTSDIQSTKNNKEEVTESDDSHGSAQQDKDIPLNLMDSSRPQDRKGKGNESSNQASNTTAENTRLLHGDKAPSRDSENVRGSAGQSNKSQGTSDIQPTKTKRFGCSKYEVEVKNECSRCSAREKLKKIDKIKPGDHITIHGSNFSKIYPCCTKYFYEHHVIVKSVDKCTTDETGAIITVYHIMPSDPTKESNSDKPKKEAIVVDTKFKVVKRVLYRRKAFDNDKICQNAHDICRSVQENSGEGHEKYSLLFNNCEHFCHKCCVNEPESHQVQEYIKCCGNTAQCCICNKGGTRLWLKILLAIGVLSADDYTANAIPGGNTNSIKIQAGMIGAMMAINILYILSAQLHLINCFFFTQKYWCHLKSRCLCRKISGEGGEKDKYCLYCHKYTTRLRWILFIVASIGQILGLGIDYILHEKYTNTPKKKKILDIVLPISISIITVIVGIVVSKISKRCRMKEILSSIEEDLSSEQIP